MMLPSLLSSKSFKGTASFRLCCIVYRLTNVKFGCFDIELFLDKVIYRSLYEKTRNIKCNERPADFCFSQYSFPNMHPATFWRGVILRGAGRVQFFEELLTLLCISQNDSCSNGICLVLGGREKKIERGHMP